MNQEENSLWIGGLDSYIDENFLLEALHAMGEENISSVRIFKNVSPSFGFINFENDYSARLALHKLNGKLIPNTSPPLRFKLKLNTDRLKPGERDHSIWVGDLTPDVDDFQVYKFFDAKFSSVKSAKVIVDHSGCSRGFGFVRFGSQQEQKSAISMSGTVGLGGKPIKVNYGSELTKNPGKYSYLETSANYAPDYNSYHQQQQQYMTQAATYASDPQSYYAAYYGSTAAATPSLTQKPPPPPSLSSNGSKRSSSPSSASGRPHDVSRKRILEGSSTELVDHSPKYNYSLLNEMYLSASEELWDAIQSALWTTSL